MSFVSAISGIECTKQYILAFLFHTVTSVLFGHGVTGPMGALRMNSSIFDIWNQRAFKQHS